MTSRCAERHVSPGWSTTLLKAAMVAVMLLAAVLAWQLLTKEIGSGLIAALVVDVMGLSLVPMFARRHEYPR